MVPARRINAVPGPQRLPQRLRHCVHQTVAAEALEGWRPTTHQIAELATLVRGDVTFADYLSAYLARHPSRLPQEAIRPARRREIPYLIPGTTVLRNNFGVDNHATLAELEFVATAGRMVHWHRRIADGDMTADHIDARSIHRALFADVYAWAGSYRVTELRLGDEAFARRSSVPRRMKRIEASARALVADDTQSRDGALACQLARLYAEYNYVHPFREGNGRTGVMILHIVASLRGHRLDLGAVSRAQWYAASRHSMPGGRGGTVNPDPFVPLLVRALG